MRYVKPDFDVTIYDIEDIITASTGEVESTSSMFGDNDGVEETTTQGTDWGDF